MRVNYLRFEVFDYGQFTEVWQLVFVCYVPDYKNLQELGISAKERIPNKQFKPFDDSS